MAAPTLSIQARLPNLSLLVNHAALHSVLLVLRLWRAHIGTEAQLQSSLRQLCSSLIGCGGSQKAGRPMGCCGPSRWKQKTQREEVA